MSVTRKVLGVAAGAVGVAAAGTALRVAQRSRVMARRGVGDATPFGSLHSPPLTVVADDGVPLHVEIDEVDRPAPARRRRLAPRPHTELTVVFVHGYALNMDSWHFQRAAYRGLVRTVFYDQRSHGRSGRSTDGNATIEQLGSDLLSVIDEAVPEGPVVLVGHSMGGMTIVALAEEHPELFGDRIVGVGPGRHHRRRARPAPDGASPAAVDRRRPAGHPAGGHAGARTPDGRPVPRGSAARSRWSPPTSSPSATPYRSATSSSSTRCSRRPPSTWSRSSSPPSAPSTSSRPCTRSRACRPRSSAAPRTR